MHPLFQNGSRRYQVVGGVVATKYSDEDERKYGNLCCTTVACGCTRGGGRTVPVPPFLVNLPASLVFFNNVEETRKLLSYHKLPVGRTHATRQVGRGDLSLSLSGTDSTPW